jgi:hypothetical protein
MVNRQTQFWDAFYSPIRKMSDALGKGYDTLFNGKDALRVNSAVSLQQTVADEQNYAATAGIQYSGPAQKLLDRATEMTKGLRDVPGEKTVNREGPSQWSYPKGMGPTAPPVVKQGNASLVGSGPSIAELRGLRSDGLALASSATNARDRALGHNIADAADDTLAKSGVLNPKEQSQLDALNGKYRSYKTIFDRSLIRKVGSSAEPTDVAGEIFNDPKRFQLLTANADRDQLSTLRRTFADWVNTSGAKVLTPAQAPELAKLFPGTPLANPKSWIYQDKALTRLEDVLQSSQEVREKAMRVYAEQLGKMKLDAGQAVLKDAQTQLPMLGNFGRRVMTDMKAAKTPDEAVAIYTKAITGMSPEQLVAEATQGPTGSEAGAAAVDQLAPTQKAPEMAQREAIMNSQLPKAAKQGLPPPTTPSEAGIQAIQTGKTPAKGSYGMMARAARNWPLYASVLGAYAAMGRTPSPFIGGMAVLGATMAGSEGIRGMYYKYIAEHPEAAVQMWQAITNPGTDSNFRTLMNMMAKGAVADSAASLGKAATGTSMEPAPADKGTGPATKALEHSRAENISPVPSGTARAEKVSKEMAMGKAPEVHKDLNRGRLSLDEVNKLISSGSKRDATAMIDNVPVDQVLDAAEIGTPDEKRMLLPMIKSKLQDQFKSKNFNRTLSVALAKRYQKLAQNVDAPVPEA